MYGPKILLSLYYGTDFLLIDPLLYEARKTHV